MENEINNVETPQQEIVENTNTQNNQNKPSTSKLVSIVVILGVILVGAWYLFGKFSANTTPTGDDNYIIDDNIVPDGFEDVTDEITGGEGDYIIDDMLNEVDDSVASDLSKQSDSDDLDDIESDLDASDLGDIDVDNL